MWTNIKKKKKNHGRDSLRTWREFPIHQNSCINSCFLDLPAGRLWMRRGFFLAGVGGSFSGGVVVWGVKAAWRDMACSCSRGGLGQVVNPVLSLLIASVSLSLLFFICLAWLQIGAFFFQFLGPGASFLPSLHVSHQFAPCTGGLRSLCGSSTMLLGF